MFAIQSASFGHIADIVKANDSSFWTIINIILGVPISPDFTLIQNLFERQKFLKKIKKK